MGCLPGNERAGPVDFNVGLGHDRRQLFVSGVYRKAFEAIGCFREKSRMKPHSNEIVAQSALIHTKIKPLKPATRFLVVKDLMFGPPESPLCCPALEEIALRYDKIVRLGPISNRLSSGAIDVPEATQFGDFFRELWDLR